ncbi:DJ-1/PfpI family protein [Promicromonospora thailandica]|uniref:DJ-1/PfpI family protein n=1 Tax=Promicromonospora thailandica TaxID=765201 RepID=A0A9X2G8H3_9MICO|nr:DJ-1/PfpI family protein [Promicromonospora thailandica]MCP2264581.1 DJ-1/PfpI family protein [Promicromonospora thailandica]BFF20351.1 DJ-1/PfpI family protein [Promicromonospora thailandica]
MTVSAQVVLFDGFDPLDVIGIYEVLTAGGMVGGEIRPWLVSAEGPRTVPSGTPGIGLTAEAVLDPERPGYVVVPGAVGPVESAPDDDTPTIPVLLARFAQSAAMPLVRRAMENPEVTVATVCGGSVALALAGLLEGRTAVTNSMGNDLLEATGVRVVDARVVDDGDLLSAGGVTSGLDLGLYVLEREAGPRIARSVEAIFEFERRGTVWADRGRVPQPL